MLRITTPPWGILTVPMLSWGLGHNKRENGGKEFEVSPGFTSSMRFGAQNPLPHPDKLGAQFHKQPQLPNLSLH